MPLLIPLELIAIDPHVLTLSRNRIASGDNVSCGDSPCKGGLGTQELAIIQDRREIYRLSNAEIPSRPVSVWVLDPRINSVDFGGCHFEGLWLEISLSLLRNLHQDDAKVLFRELVGKLLWSCSWCARDFEA